MAILIQYSIVRIVALQREFDQSNVERGLDQRVPRIGDVATVLEVYLSPTLGYELESSNSDGTNEWLITFYPEDSEFEVVQDGADAVGGRGDFDGGTEGGAEGEVGGVIRWL